VLLLKATAGAIFDDDDAVPKVELGKKVDVGTAERATSEDDVGGTELGGEDDRVA
jgi:hypothetical protein